MFVKKGGEAQCYCLSGELNEERLVGQVAQDKKTLLDADKVEQVLWELLQAHSFIYHYRVDWNYRWHEVMALKYQVLCWFMIDVDSETRPYCIEF